MRAMVVEKARQPLVLRDVLKPKPKAGQLLVRVSACAVCRTDLHIVDGELPDPKLPLILGHQIVGRVEEIGEEASNFAIGGRVGIPWLGWTDGECAYCRSGRENLCDNARFTGYTIDGGYDELPPEKIDAAIIFASVGSLVSSALRALAKGGIVVCGGIHMTDIPSFPYANLWEERVITSVANLTRRDGDEFFEIAPRVPVQTHTETFPLEKANFALNRFRAGKLSATAVLKIA